MLAPSNLFNTVGEFALSRRNKSPREHKQYQHVRLSIYRRLADVRQLYGKPGADSAPRPRLTRQACLDPA
jgi:hypothetical protein